MTMPPFAEGPMDLSRADKQESHGPQWSSHTHAPSANYQTARMQAMCGQQTDMQPFLQSQIDMRTVFQGFPVYTNCTVVPGAAQVGGHIMDLVLPQVSNSEVH